MDARHSVELLRGLERSCAFQALAAERAQSGHKEISALFNTEPLRGAMGEPREKCFASCAIASCTQHILLTQRSQRFFCVYYFGLATLLRKLTVREKARSPFVQSTKGSPGFRGQRRSRRTECSLTLHSQALRANTKRHGREIARRAIEATRTPSGLMSLASPAAARASSPFGSSRPCRHERAPFVRHKNASCSRRDTKMLRPCLDAS